MLFQMHAYIDVVAIKGWDLVNWTMYCIPQLFIKFDCLFWNFDQVSAALPCLPPSNKIVIHEQTND